MPPLDQPALTHGHLNRREFITLMGASLTLAGLSGCRNKMPDEEILPFIELPENTVAGESRFFATTFPVPGFVQGLLVESHEGHPTKIEGNSIHPASNGATSLFAQASILDLYSPFRLKFPASKTGGDWLIFRKALTAALETHNALSGVGLAVLTTEVTSPTLRAQLAELNRALPKGTCYLHEPVDRGVLGETQIDFAKAKRILSIDCDFLGYERRAVANASAYAAARRKSAGQSRLYIAETGLSITGTKADHRWALGTKDLYNFLNQVDSALSGKAGATKDIQALADDLKSHPGESVVIGGYALPKNMHRLIHEINQRLQNLGATIQYNPPSFKQLVPQGGLAELVAEIREGKIQTLIILGGNPVYTAPAELGFRAALESVSFSVHLTQVPNETSSLAKWSLPESHYLESWGDAESADGTESLIQPLLAPLHESITSHEIMNWLVAKNDSTYQTVRNYWRSRLENPKPDVFELAWRDALTKGQWPNQTHAKSNAKFPLDPPSAEISTNIPLRNSREASEIEIIFRPDPTVWDGRFSENPWLQELPKPPSQLCWDNALCLSPILAAAREITTGDLLRVKTAHGELDAAAFIQDGLPEKTLTLSLGYGRENSGPVATGAGFNANLIRSSASPWRAEILTLEKTGRRYELACTQAHHSMDGRDLLKVQSPEEASGARPNNIDPGIDIGHGSLGPHIPAVMQNPSEQWAMSIDTDSCIGCSVCVIACQAENNIPVVGKKMVMMGREMQWIRIDRYATKNRAAPAPLPVTCMHCETAPCEVVCPVGATSHSTTGLNQMVYNRCVGTRYCSNNCPYKVRRFNFFKFSENTDALAEQRNPDVTVRSRGVMEKCSYCVQRIERARIQSSQAQRAIADGEIETACQQSCPTKAILFGNLMDPKSRIHETKSSARTHGLLTDLGTRPRTTYLAQISNPNPLISGSK
jgi:Fe-S-cluster-containing dehydrogenase component